MRTHVRTPYATHSYTSPLELVSKRGRAHGGRPPPRRPTPRWCRGHGTVFAAAPPAWLPARRAAAAAAASAATSAAAASNELGDSATAADGLQLGRGGKHSDGGKFKLAAEGTAAVDSQPSQGSPPPDRAHHAPSPRHPQLHADARLTHVSAAGSPARLREWHRRAHPPRPATWTPPALTI